MENKDKNKPVDTSQMVTGSVVIRHKTKLADGRTAAIIFGVIALPEDVDLENETQYCAIGAHEPGKVILTIAEKVNPQPEVLLEAMGVSEALVMTKWRL